MKSKLLALLFIGIFALTVTGCGKEKTLEKIEVKGPRVVCTTTSEEDGIKVDATATLKFNSDNYVNYQLMETTMTFKDKKVFDAYAKSMEEDTMEFGDDIEYNYAINKKKKQISSYMIYKESLFDYSKVSDEDKADYKASVIIEKYDDDKATCEFIETTRQDLGIE